MKKSRAVGFLLICLGTPFIPLMFLVSRLKGEFLGLSSLFWAGFLGGLQISASLGAIVIFALELKRKRTTR